MGQSSFLPGAVYRGMRRTFAASPSSSHRELSLPDGDFSVGELSSRWSRITKAGIMRVHVERDAGDVDFEKLKRFRFDGRRVEVIENIDRWFGADYVYFKVRGDDGNLYILRLDEACDAWELTMFQSPTAETFAAVGAVPHPHGKDKS